MDILDVIEGEHRDVTAKLDEANACEPGDARLVELAREISAALVTHSKLEERLFYPKLRERSKDDEELVDVYEAYTEHDVVAHLIELLKSGRKPDEKFKAEVQVLGESVKHHEKEEESTLFGIARELIDRSERDDLGEQWAKARKRADAQTPGAPRRKATARKKTTARSKAPARSGTRRVAKRTPSKRR
jgi:hemerythrin superfamily protein